MPVNASSKLPAPNNWDEFEDIVLSAVQLRFGTTEAHRHGRLGQRQHGVDIYIQNDDCTVFGVQCKNIDAKLNAAFVNQCVQHAKSFHESIHKLKRFYIATATDRDVAFQRHVMQNQMHYPFYVGVLFWPDIVADICLDDNVVRKHYPQYQVIKQPLHQLDRQKIEDERNYNDLMELLPSQRVAGILAACLRRFNNAILDPLEEFYCAWNFPERKFLDQELEALRLNLHQKVVHYLRTIKLKTFPDRCYPELSSIPPEWRSKWPEGYQRADDYDLAFERISQSGSDLAEAHRKLVKAARIHFTS